MQTEINDELGPVVMGVSRGGCVVEVGCTADPQVSVGPVDGRTVVSEARSSESDVRR